MEECRGCNILIDGQAVQVVTSNFYAYLVSNLQLDGSLIVIAGNVMGSTRIDANGEPMLQYGRRYEMIEFQMWW